MFFYNFFFRGVFYVFCHERVVDVLDGFDTLRGARFEGTEGVGLANREHQLFH